MCTSGCICPRKRTGTSTLLAVNSPKERIASGAWIQENVGERAVGRWTRARRGRVHASATVSSNQAVAFRIPDAAPDRRVHVRNDVAAIQYRDVDIFDDLDDA